MLAIALGDPTGIGPEVALKAIAAELPRDTERYLLFGDASLVHELNGRLELNLEIKKFPHESARVMIANISDGPAPLSAGTVHYEGLAFRVKQDPGSPEAARFALASLKFGAQWCLNGRASGLVTAPVNKEAIIRSGETSFVGQTELLSEMAGTKRTAMMLLGTDDRGRWLRVALATIWGSGGIRSGAP